MRIKRRVPSAVALLSLVCLALVVAACGGGGSSTSTEAATTESSTPAESAESSTSAESTSGGAEVTEEAAAEFRKPEPGSGKGLKLGYIAIGNEEPFSATVTESMENAAKEAGAQLVSCDAQTDGQKALECARSFASQGVEGYLNFQPDQELSEAICNTGPEGPVIAIDVHQKPCEISFMGADNQYAGFIAGKALGEFAKNEWNCEYDAYISLEQPEAGVVNEERMGGYREGFKTACPGEIKNEKVLNAARSEAARSQISDTLTSLPSAHHVLIVGIADDPVLGALAAAKTVGREGDVYVSGQGTSADAWCDIKNNPQWVSDTAYFPERYGEIGIPYLIEAVKGKKIPTQLLVPHELVTSENISDLYEVNC